MGEQGDLSLSFRMPCGHTLEVHVKDNIAIQKEKVLTHIF